MRITAQLIHGETDSHLWAKSYDRDLEDILTLQSEVARAIVDGIQFSLTPEQEERLTPRSRVDLEAYDAYLLGRHHWNQRSRDSLSLALGYFQGAIQRDPTFARAYAGLADTYLMMEIYSHSPPKDVHPTAKAMARRALDIDPTLGEAHTSLAWSYFTYDFDWTSAEDGFQQAIRLSPGYATAHHWYGVFLSAVGRFEDARAMMAQARELDPLSPVILAQLAFPSFSEGDMDGASNAYRSAIAKFPGFPMPHTGLARSLLVSGAYQEAMGEIELAEPMMRNGLLGMAYGYLGRTREAQEILLSLAALSRDRHVPATEFVYVYTGLGQKERALQDLGPGLVEAGLHRRARAASLARSCWKFSPLPKRG